VKCLLRTSAALLLAALAASACGFDTSMRRAVNVVTTNNPCQEASTPAAPNGRSWKRFRETVFESFCRNGVLYVGAVVRGKRALPLRVADARIVPHSPGGGLEILVALGDPPPNAVAIARVPLVGNIVLYQAFSVKDRRVVRLTLRTSARPFVLYAGLRLNGGSGFRCRTVRQTLVLEQFSWGVAPNEVKLATKGRVHLDRWRYRVLPPMVFGGRIATVTVSFAVARRLSNPSCRGSNG
jgi:hypothetical protein